MEQLKKGNYFGISKKKITYDGLLIADTEYPAPVEVPWHYHENSYFTYFITGHLMEINKTHSYNCIPGALVFHNWQEPHYNTKHSNYMHYFHVELEKKWFDKYQLQIENFEGKYFFK